MRTRDSSLTQADMRFANEGKKSACLAWNDQQEERDQLTSLALTVISALKSFETGQPVSAAFTAASNLALSAPGTCATRSRWLFVIANPSGNFSSEIVAVVSSLLAVMPALPNCADSAIVKHPACAAASSSSGLVPIPFSKRVLKEYCVCLSTPLSVDIVPFPSFNPPCQTAEPFRCMTALLLASVFVRISVFDSPP